MIIRLVGCSMIGCVLRLLLTFEKTREGWHRGVRIVKGRMQIPFRSRSVNAVALMLPTGSRTCPAGWTYYRY